MMTALLLPVLLGAGGISIDLTKMMMTKNRLQDASDSAALAAASALANDNMSIEDAKLLALEFIKTQMQSGGASPGDPDSADTGGQQEEETNAYASSLVQIDETSTVGTGKSWVINVSANYEMPLNPLTRLLVKDKTTISASTTAESATESKSALSMFLVLDRSGSMSFKTDDIASRKVPCKNWTEKNWQKPEVTAETPCYVRKIAALKSAVANLTTQLNTADPEMELVRTAAVSYNDRMQPETQLAWGTAGASAYVNALPTEPTGGTDSHAAFAKALDKLVPADASDETENPAHKDKNGQVPTKYIIFMTDGENTAYDGKSTDANGRKSDTETKASCDKARTAKVEVFTVAFMAPTRGQTLLKYCATTQANYFEADDMTQLVAAFKAIGEKAVAAVARLTH
ncbi:vWA domain-containing protein [Rhizobium sp. GN54]|uniref:vWA domain-containing protein n=1 Tax=Rhizobium sp. GN54 TaxID=2898150 RepID=UPI001E309B41|nr:VWA domain-containing protein [Rhizobium sp. GN54]MCD2183064.1 VWA domain-containing protein [Rhizobium sp. GN54]